MTLLMPKRLLSSSGSFLASFLLASSSAYASVDIEQQPLLVAQPVAANMSIIGSFEFPTMVTRAYKGAYASAGEYVGYFDSGKCYKYRYSDTEANRHFYPSRVASNCSQTDEWSGKYLNWATMQSIDIFRHILTGGYRRLDTTTETWLEKGVQTGQGNSSSNYPDANINSGLVASTPIPGSAWSAVNTRIGVANTRMGNVMRFTGSADLNSANRVAYNPAIHHNGTNFLPNVVYEVSVRVKVCVAGMLEANCKKYGNNYKPEGLIQDNADNVRYSAFGYLNDNSSPNPNRDGGIMHARMKYVGPEKISDQNLAVNNSNAEWSADTGVFVQNPDPLDASATTSRYPGLTPINHSGVISYINNSGLIVPGTLFKRYDNVSELFYTAYRYMRGLPNRSEYINISQSGTALNQLVGGLPIINWSSSEADDPIQFACQKNFFLGIGDTNTHPDTRVPKADDTVDVATRVSRISSLEGGLNITGGRSALIAGLAFDANTKDMRPDMEGKQTAATYWIDILEGGDLKARTSNQYWLAAKYGGLKVPEEFNPDSDPIEENMWYTNGETLNSSGYKRPDNFYVVANAQDMVDGLTQAFTDIRSQQAGSSSSVALNSRKLEAGSAAYQTVFNSAAWSGELNAFTLDPDTGEVSASPVWSASSRLPTPANRNIKTWDGSSYVNFSTDTGGINNTTLTNALKVDSGTSASVSVAQIVNYLRGDRAAENNATGLRVRQSALGDMVNSQPIFVGNPVPGRFGTRSFNGSDSYASWASSLNRAPTVYVGSNDGMLHGFNATIGQDASGVETFAYVPRTVIENGMGELASPAYDHRYFVDGEIAVTDAYDGESQSWRTVLVGTLGAGGVNKARTGTRNAIFALDVTNPSEVTFLWEKNSVDIPQLGNNLGRPVIAQTGNGDWSLLLGNGPNSDSGRASLISLNLFSGDVKTTNMSTEVNNGLSAVRAWDSSGDGITDTIYAGDLQGNLWKVTRLDRSNPTVVKLFRALDPNNDPQPITSAPLAGRSPFSNEVWLFFGTGQYLNNADLADRQVQTWYGINDNGLTTTATVRRGDDASDLLERRILLEVPFSTDETARVIEEGTREELSGKRGWFIDLYQVAQNGSRTAIGERMVTPNEFRGGALLGNSRIPDASDPCAPTGRGVLMAIEPFTGARLSDTFFDLNRDRAFSVLDMIDIDGVMTVVSGRVFDGGISNPSSMGGLDIISPYGGEPPISEPNPGGDQGSTRTSWRELINIGN
ncbi:pilus assembly protein [Halopseudomonas pelagia]|uniref:PilY1 beta-propeller domain-containing protein n=1 Tax=Halopseudomonas pelagia TaxID=553151 RepID=A0AA91Z7E2_9GAMM|nr:PilC/PilY family type IV pilus protein [Halopseudomonas pelagia]PCD00817.1 hypothetical protein CO192_03195 [Halopseudomonas pelagia]QFY58107.1 hypothetical protein EAO82_18070 [Halopseudomonas pelagia]